MSVCCLLLWTVNGSLLSAGVFRRRRLRGVTCQAARNAEEGRTTGRQQSRQTRLARLEYVSVTVTYCYIVPSRGVQSIAVSMAIRRMSICLSALPM